MFKFLKDNNDGVGGDSNSSTETRHLVELIRAYEVMVSEKHYQLIDNYTSQSLPASNIKLRHSHSKSEMKSDDGVDQVVQISHIQIPQLLNLQETDDNVRHILKSTSDLIPSVYEGGFKIWECTLDLLKYLYNHQEAYQLGVNSRVMDLGCGSGLLGIYALKFGSYVHFQDYNHEVLDFLTIPNVLLNYKNSDETVSRCQFFRGDWSSFQNDLVTDGKKDDFQYDFVFSSETTYNLDSLPKLYSLIKHCLKPNGIMLLAAKTCYFGVGGGTQSFLSLVNTDNRMVSEVVQTMREGVQREIILLKFKEPR